MENNDSRMGILAALVILLAIALLALILMPSAPVVSDEAQASDDIVHLTILHMNDIYELNAVSGGRWGGMARVATIRNELLARNPNTITTLGGDLLNPSALGSAEVDGVELEGRQMVDTMNAVGLDYAAFGNHEFDLDEEPFLKRLDESEFTWLSANAFAADGSAYPDVPENVTLTFSNDQGQQMSVGIFGVAITKNAPDYVTFTDPIEAAGRQVDALGNVDVLIGLTHQSFADDTTLVETYPEIDLVVGGHEHQNGQIWRGTGGYTPIYKADVNARTVYIIDLYYNTTTGELRIEDEFRFLDESVALDPVVGAVADEWTELGYAGLLEANPDIDPAGVVTTVDEALDGREASVRFHSTNLTDTIAAGMLLQAGEGDIAFFNGGSIRLDDFVGPGDVTGYDLYSILPYGGDTLSVDVSGSQLLAVLRQGELSPGGGSFLQYACIQRTDDDWLINGESLEEDRTYRAVINDFLISKWSDFTMLAPDEDGNDTVGNIANHGDIRNALVAGLEAFGDAPACP